MVLASITSLLALLLSWVAYRRPRAAFLLAASLTGAFSFALWLGQAILALNLFPCRPVNVDFHSKQNSIILPPPSAESLQRIDCNNFGGNKECRDGYGARIHSQKENPGKSQILFLGDSFTFGTGVSDEESFPAQLQGFGRFNSTNLGQSGGGINNAFHALRTKKVPPGEYQAAVYTFIPDHFARASGRYGFFFNSALPHYSLGKEGEWQHHGSFYQSRNASLWFFLLGQDLIGLFTSCNPRRSFFLHASEVQAADVELTRNLMLATKAEFEKNYGGTFVLHVWPGTTFPGKKEFFSSLEPDMPVWEMPEEVLINSATGHPSPKANRAVAKFLEGKLEQLKLSR
jgi:hypothetical protein